MPLDGPAPAVINRGEKIVQDLIGRAEVMRTKRGNFDAMNQMIRDAIVPTLSAFITKETPGAQSHLRTLDSTPEQAVELLVSALYAGLVTGPWLNLRALDDDLNKNENASRALERWSKTLLSLFDSPTGNFQTGQIEKYGDLVPFGEACMYMADLPGRGISFQTRPIQECYFAENEFNRIDTNFRWFRRSARQAVQQFNGKNVGEKVLKAYSDPKRIDDEFQFLHATYPRSDRDPTKYDPRNMSYASCWVNIDEKVLIAENGYPEFPYACPRWSKRAGEVNGRGPGAKMLADARMLNRAMKITIRGVEKKVDPPLIVAHDGVLSPVRVSPSGINYVESDLMRGGLSPIHHLDTGAQPQLGEQFMESLRERIQFACYTHLIQFARDPEMTATQFLGISEQTARVLAPILARLHAEDNNPMIQRVFPMALRGGLLGDVPPELAGQPLRVEYVSPLTHQQRIGEARAFAQGIEMATPLLPSHPEILDNADIDKGMRAAWSAIGWSKEWIRKTEEVQQIRAARQQATEQQAKRTALQETADTAHTMASAAGLAKDALTKDTQTAGAA